VHSGQTICSRILCSSASARWRWPPSSRSLTVKTGRVGYVKAELVFGCSYVLDMGRAGLVWLGGSVPAPVCLACACGGISVEGGPVREDRNDGRGMGAKFDSGES
jgi:hypothetical protein